MPTILTKIISVIESCKTEEQINCCLTWINTMDLLPMEREAYAARISKKREEIVGSDYELYGLGS